jgi:CubicO group peptidase (beta-lactamase class C family)
MKRTLEETWRSRGAVRWVAAALAAAIAVHPSPLPAQTTAAPQCATQVAPPRPDYRRAIAAARTLIRDTLAAEHIPGFSVAVAVDGHIIWAEGFGFADVENHVPASPCTRMRIGSISKSLTSAAIAQLVAQGKLDLDAPVQRYVPSFPKKRWPITSRQVAGHLAGLRHYRGDEFLSMRHYDNVVDGLAIFENDSLLFEPGTKYSYSTYGYNLLSAVVESASGESYLAYMRRHVFEPLGMRWTVAEFPDSILDYRAHFYVHDSTGKLLNAPYVDNSYKWAGGGFLSTAGDLVRYGSALLKPGFLSRESLSLLFTSQRTSDGKPSGYGVGWFIGTIDGQPVEHHGGGSVGGNAHLAIFPERHLVIAVIANAASSFAGSGAAVWQIARLFPR